MRSANKNEGRFSRPTVLRVATLAILAKAMQPRLWPWGFAQPWTDRMEYALVDHSNDSLQMKRKSGNLL